tara:strand:- start:358 stop:591 length:234 start_codon:yes stop_codon:yes gene_type:complete
MELSSQPTYVSRLQPDEAFILLQLLDQAQILGKQAEQIAKLRKKLVRVLGTHTDKTGEYVGYPPVQPEAQPNGGVNG